MKKGILFLNGDPPSVGALERVRAEVEKSGAEVFCTDGAYKYLSAVMEPCVLLGDFDSLDIGEVKSDCEILKFPPEKDFTDGYLAVRIMIDRGFTDIDIYGGFGGRADMTESNYTLLVLALKSGVSARMCGNITAYICDKLFVGNVPIGATVSVVPFSDALHILYTKGLKYALTDYVMTKFEAVGKPDYVMGVSNEATDERVEIAFGSGIALVFVQESGR